MSSAGVAHASTLLVLFIILVSCTAPPVASHVAQRGIAASSSTGSSYVTQRADPAGALGTDIGYRVQGIFSTIYGDGHNVSQTRYYLSLANQTRISLDFDSPPFFGYSGENITVTGGLPTSEALADGRFEKTMHVTTLTPLAQTGATGSASGDSDVRLGSASGTFRIILLPLQFSDDAASSRLPTWTGYPNPGDSNYYDNLINTLVNNFYQADSWGQFGVHGDIANGGTWMVLPHTKWYYAPCGFASACADLGAVGNDGIALGLSHGVNFANYDAIGFILSNDLDCCAWGGGWYDTLNGVTKVWGATWEPPWGQHSSVYSHETGHSIGLHHSGWVYYAYDSPWDIMSDSYDSPATGCGSYYSLNDGVTESVYCYVPEDTIAPYKDVLGWIDSSHKLSVTSSATVQVDSLAAPLSSAYKMLKICVTGYSCATGGSTSRYLTVEVRTQYGPYDQYLPGEGVIIHMYQGSRPAVSGSCFFNSQSGPAYPIDSTPGDYNSAGCNSGGRSWPNYALFNAQWSVGQTYNIPSSMGGGQIKVLSRSGNTFTILAAATSNLQLSVFANPSAAGTIALSPTASSNLYAVGSSIRATATAAVGFYFVGWGLDGAYAGNTNPISFTMNSNHQLTAYFQLPSQWTKGPTPVLTPSVGSWDDWQVVNPRLFTYPDKTFGMVYVGVNVNGTAGIGLATSPDGIRWTKYSYPILTRGSTGQWDNRSVWLGSVFWDGSQFLLYYRGSSPTTGAGFGLATSLDSIHWTKHIGNPILTPSTSAETSYFQYPYVIKIGGKYMIWYTAGNSIALATSTDGTSWVRHNGGLPVLTPSSNPQAWDAGTLYSSTVIFDDAANKYKMFYSAADSNFVIWRTGLAVSTDGIMWTRYSGNPIVGPSAAGSWDSADSTDNQGILPLNGQLLAYYSADKVDRNNNLISYSVGLASASEIPLMAGWNLISLPLIPSSTAITSVLGSLTAANEVSIVWSYTGTGSTRSWMSFRPGAPSTLTTMQDGSGYWVYMLAPDTLYVGGTVIAPASTPPTYQLIQGWNLLGFKPQPTVQNETVGAYLSSIDGKYDPNNVWSFDNSSASWIRAASSTWLKPGQAMWILITTPSGATLKP